MAPKNGPPPRILRFAILELDLQARELRKNGLKLKLQGQPLEILAMLLERPGEVVSRDQLRERLWPTDTFVDFDHGVNTAINRLREALGDSSNNLRFIETLPRRDYRFLASVESAKESVATPHQRKKLVWILAAVLLLAFLIAANVGDFRRRLFGQQPRAPIQSIAGLPLMNLSNDVNQDYFADGMTEALTTGLGKISALLVISRTSVMQVQRLEKVFAGDCPRTASGRPGTMA